MHETAHCKGQSRLNPLKQQKISKTHIPLTRRPSKMKHDSFIYLIFPNPEAEMTRESPKMSINFTHCLH